MRLVVGDRGINEVISKREEIADQAKVLLQKELEGGGPVDTGPQKWGTKGYLPLHPAAAPNYSFFKNGLNRSIGIGKSVVELLSAETSLRV